MPEKFIDYEGSVKITIELGDGRVVQIEKESAQIWVTHEDHELPDEHHGYVLHKLRKEDIYTFSLTTKDNWDLDKIEDKSSLEIIMPEDVDLSPEFVDTESETKFIDYESDIID